jgi:hypothetical protein
MKKGLETAVINSPVELVLRVGPSEEAQISKSVVEFYNLAQNSDQARKQANFDPVAETLSQLKAKQLISYLNFIRFTHDQTTESNSSKSMITESNNNSKNSKTAVPSFSLILLTNSPISSQTCAPASTVNPNAWSYQYKIELNDEQGRTLARQLFYKLACQSKTPLCCNSNWISPLSTASQSTRSNSPQNPPPLKYIIRLNMNCKNYDLMLFFYRLLFAKYPSYSKPHFTLFVLQQNDHKFKILNEIGNSLEPQVEEETVFVDFQFSLKHDSSVIVEQSPMTLVHNVYDPAVFTSLVGLFDGFIEEIVKNKVYSIFDPDQNRIFLVNKSAVGESATLSRNSSTSSIALEETVAPGCAHIFNTSGLGDQYFSLGRRTSNHMTHSANLNSPSETASYDSSKDSANWSFSSGSNHMTINDAFNYKELHMLKGQQRAGLCHNEHSGSVKNLIKKFNNQQLTGLAGYPSSNKSFLSCNNLKKMHLLKKKKLSSEEDDEYEEDEGLEYSDDSNDSVTRTPNTSIDPALKNLIKKERELKQIFRGKPSMMNKSLNDLSEVGKFKPETQRVSRSRCLSAVGHEEPPSSPVYLTSERPRKHSASSSLLKKSKSVTFLDSIDQIDHVNSVINQRIENYDFVNQGLIERERSKSTIPFAYSNARYSNRENSQVPDYNSVNYRTIPVQVIDRGRENYSNCLIDPKFGSPDPATTNRFNLAVPPRRNLMMVNPSRPKPCVGVTPESRFRRTHTLNMIRNSQMPLSHNDYHRQFRQNEYFIPASSAPPSNYKILSYNYPIAKF